VYSEKRFTNKLELHCIELN